MIALIRAEFRKILTVRSTFLNIGFSVFLVLLMAFFIEGYKSTVAIKDPNFLAGEAVSAISILALISSIVGVLLVTHEYRYNTIVYTLTASRSRTKVLLAKIVAITCFAVVMSLFYSTLSPIAAYLGVQLKGTEMVHQVIPVSSLLWRCVFEGWGYAMFGLMVATILRNQVATIMFMFIVPTTLEQLAAILLKDKAAYLPFRALESVVQHIPDISISYGKAALVVVVYLVIGWLITWQLFLRRDAN